MNLFQSAEQRRKDDDDLQELHVKYGDTIIEVLRARCDNENLRSRDRKHWSRLLRKARSQFSD
jgi:hypothetical protein